MHSRMRGAAHDVEQVRVVLEHVVRLPAGQRVQLLVEEPELPRVEPLPERLLQRRHPARRRRRRLPSAAMMRHRPRGGARFRSGRRGRLLWTLRRWRWRRCSQAPLRCSWNQPRSTGGADHGEPCTLLRPARRHRRPRARGSAAAAAAAAAAPTPAPSPSCSTATASVAVTITLPHRSARHRCRGALRRRGGRRRRGRPRPASRRCWCRRCRCRRRTCRRRRLPQLCCNAPLSALRLLLVAPCERVVQVRRRRCGGGLGHGGRNICIRECNGCATRWRRPP